MFYHRKTTKDQPEKVLVSQTERGYEIEFWVGDKKHIVFSHHDSLAGTIAGALSLLNDVQYDQGE